MKILIFVSLLYSYAFAVSENDFQSLNSLSQTISRSACLKGKYFSHCFQISESACNNQVQASIKSCFNMHSNTIKSDKNGTFDKWEKTILDCAERDLNRKLSSKIKPMNECKLEKKK